MHTFSNQDSFVFDFLVVLLFWRRSLRHDMGKRSSRARAGEPWFRGCSATSSRFGGSMRVPKVSFRWVSSFGRPFLCGPVIATWTIGLAIALTAAPPASAQVLYGSIVGNVVDQKGAVIPGAAVLATNQGTGVAASTTTNGVGEYSFVTLQAGTYTIKVAAAGFKTFERRDLLVEANNITRTDVDLEVGSKEEAVTVTGAA